MAWEGGLAEGVAKGRAIERVKSRAGSVIRVLSRRFRTVSKPVKDKVCSITDTDRLDELMDQAVDCRSLDEFAKALNNR